MRLKPQREGKREHVWGQDRASKVHAQGSTSSNQASPSKSQSHCEQSIAAIELVPTQSPNGATCWDQVFNANSFSGQT